MQSSETALENQGGISAMPFLEHLSWLDKLPFAFVFGCVLGLASPGFDQWWLAWIALAPLLILLRGATSLLDAGITGAGYGMGYYLVSLSWYLGLFPLRWLGLYDFLGVQAAALAWILESLHQSLLFAAFALMIFCLPLRAGYFPYFKRPFFPYLFSVPIIWVFLQWAVGTSEVFVGMPVNQLAYSQCRQTELIQIAKLGGSGLIDFFLVLVNAAAAEIVIETFMVARRLPERVDQISARLGCWVDAAVVLAVVLLLRQWGVEQVHEIANATRPDNEANYFLQTPTVPVGVIQGNVTIEEDRLKTTGAAEIDRRYTSLSRNLGVSLLAYPEGLVTTSQMAPDMLLGHLKGIAVHEKKEIVVGSIENFGPDVVNAARLISPATTKQSLYVKRRLVPFGEFAPLGSLGQQINGRLPMARESFVASKSTNLLRCMWGGIGTSICIELVYPHLISDEVRHGAHLLINVSNLGWFHQSSLNKQILAAAILRAVENGRYFVVSANTGISAVIDPSGTVTSVSYPNRRGVLLDTVQFLYNQTPFSKMWWL